MFKLSFFGWLLHALTVCWVTLGILLTHTSLSIKIVYPNPCKEKNTAAAPISGCFPFSPSSGSSMTKISSISMGADGRVVTLGIHCGKPGMAFFASGMKGTFYLPGPGFDRLNSSLCEALHAALVALPEPALGVVVGP